MSFLNKIFSSAKSQAHRSQMVLLIEHATKKFGMLDCDDPFFNAVSRSLVLVWNRIVTFCWLFLLQAEFHCTTVRFVTAYPH